MKNRIIITVLIFLVSAGIAAAQDANKTETPGTGDNQTQSEPVKAVAAVLPEVNPDIIFVEAEDAVSTNFNREPILNYSCSGYRTLQLNQTIDAPKGSSYFVDFVFYAEKDGNYELWYGGTPPGNKDELLPSYASPFTLKVDEFNVDEIYRENIHVAGNYAPAYYWNYVKDITLSAGEHRLSFEIPLRRGYDNKYFFYIDNFFLIRKENGKRILSGTLPKVFPRDLDDRSMDHPFRSIEEYQILIRDNPENAGNYVEISMVYSLIGDYLNALKNLRKALLLNPDDPDIKLLIAKNLIWKGAFYDGLEEYKDLLILVPKKLDYWMEAGKVAAWIGQYEDSVTFFKDGLKEFPDNLNLLANLGITYLWTADKVNADKVFKQVDQVVGDDVGMFKELASIFLINGYPDKAIEIYTKALEKHPEDLELYFSLENAYIQAGKRSKIADLRKTVSEVFIKTPELEKSLQVFYNKQKMKEDVLKKYQADLANDPDNLTLRKTLAEMYFWNGYKKEAIDEYLNILTNYTYRTLRDTEKETARFLELLDKSYVFYNFLKKLPEYTSRSKKELSTSFSAYNSAVKKLEALKQKNEKIKAKGGTVSEEEETALEDEVRNKEDEFASLLSAKETFIEKYRNIVEQFRDDSDYLTRLLEDEEGKKEAFEKLTKGASWEWDKTAMIKELKKVKDNGLSLADFDLGVISQFEGDLESARENLESISSGSNVKGAEYAFFQTLLWTGEEKNIEQFYETNKDAIEGATDYIPDVVEYIHYLSTDDEEMFGFLPENPDESVKNLYSEYTGINGELKSLNLEVRESISRIHGFLKERMTQNFYNLAENTYLLRNELGDFYQNQKLYPEAIDQYKQVLAVEPWDISAKYKLGQVLQRNGDWSKAQKLYKEVYMEDPVYGNVTAFYNQLAKEHADHLVFTGTVFIDSSVISAVSDLNYRTNINGTLSLGVDYSSNYNLYPLNTADTYAPTLYLQNVSFLFPLIFPRFTITPEVGGTVLSNLVEQDSRAEYLSDTSPVQMISTFRAYPTGSISCDIVLGSIIVSGGYRYNWVEESFRAGRSPVSYQEGNGSIQVDFGFIKKPVIQNTGISVYGSDKFYSDNNSTYSISSEINNYFRVAEKSDVSMGILGYLSWEDSSGNSTDYWSPSESLRAGGSINVLSSFPWSEEGAIGDNLRFSTGYYSDDTGSGVEMSLSNEINYSNKAFSGYLKLSGSVKGRFDYWSFTIELGADAGLPDLLSL